MPITNSKFSNFADGGALQEDDEVVGLRDGVNTRFTYQGALPPGFITPIVNGGTGADNVPDARDNLGLGTMAIQNANAVNISGGTAALGSGQVAAAPSNATDIVNKQALDTAILNVNTFTARVATTTNFSATYNNGSSGVGATLTATSNGAASIDGVSLSVNDVVLFKNQTSSFQNGLYKLTTNGTVGTQSIYTRSTDYDQPSEIIPGDLISVVSGTQNSSSSWQQTATVTAVGTDPILFTIFSQYGKLPQPFFVGGNQVNSNATQLNLLSGLTLVPINKVVTQSINVSGTYTPTPGMKYCFVHAIAGGGGSGGSVGGGAGTSGLGAGGGSGAEVWAWFDAATIGASQSVTIGSAGLAAPSGGTGGDGGSTSFGSLISLTGGGGGAPGTSTSTGLYSVGGTGGGIVTIPAGQVGRNGEAGLFGFTIGGIAGVPGKGGASSLGGGGKPAVVGNSVGSASINKGDGGGGSYSTTVSQIGAAGGAGIVWITEYIAA